ncbi:adenosylcobinamide kinase/adenosylcobinamide-phosphate guanylyltransferase [Novosphingobium chloroacetimidivorans]|uniref:Adenosylcobinamide kinase n=1 Tax=Novosphingobium chloroacetimidivorans TaxID=1428314 RepID=A0A7W7NX97_9SPHN|nr:adenosylcobinamide kinase/adenosylcobinamide-phosphate guanylyltransferase [Novosphingobium chloroacetimidivorans]
MLPGKLAFIATAQAQDDELADRIARHRADRGPRWTAYEAPIALCDAIEHASRECEAILIDCMTLWLSNLMHADADIAAATADLMAAIRVCSAPLTIVSNEVGGGIVPMNALARRFRDHAGWLHQQLASVAGEVVLVTAGLPLQLKCAEPSAMQR